MYANYRRFSCGYRVLCTVFIYQLKKKTFYYFSAFWEASVQ
jgi:hypothetical protein